MTDDQIKEALQQAGFHNGPGPYMASGTLENFRNLLSAYGKDAERYRYMREIHSTLDKYVDGKLVGKTQIDNATFDASIDAMKAAADAEVANALHHGGKP